jgi:chromosome segregation ATPase
MSKDLDLDDVAAMSVTAQTELVALNNRLNYQINEKQKVYEWLGHANLKKNEYLARAEKAEAELAAIRARVAELEGALHGLLVCFDRETGNCLKQSASYDELDIASAALKGGE